MPVVSVQKSFIGSDAIVNTLFDALNKNFFNCSLDGITLKWLNELNTRTAVGVIAKKIFNTKTMICLSKPLLAKCTRKQLIESILVRIAYSFFYISISYQCFVKTFCSLEYEMLMILLIFFLSQYEMLSLYIDSKLTEMNNNNSNSDSDDEKSKHFQVMLKYAMDSINESAAINLSFNYTHRAHLTTDSFDEWVDVDDEINVHKCNDTVICISDDDEKEDDDFQEIRKMGYVSIKSVTDKINVRDIPEHDSACSTNPMVICCCCTNYKELKMKIFAGTNIYLFIAQKCSICSQTIENRKLIEHFCNACNIF